MPFLALLLLLGLVGAGCQTVCPYCPPGTHPADPTASCSPCVKPEGGVTVVPDAGDAPADRTDLAAEAPAEAGDEARAEARAEAGDEARAEAGDEAGQDDANADASAD